MKNKLLLKTAKDANHLKRLNNSIKCILILKCLIVFLCFGLSVQEVSGNFEKDNIYSFNLDQETDQFLKAKEYVFKGEWNQARLQLEKYLVKFPEGNYRDEALYWLAKSLNKLAQDEVILNKVISLKEEAAAHLDSLIKNYSESLWYDDGKTLRLSIASELDMMGKYGHKQILMEFLSNHKNSEEDIKEITINALLEMRPEAAVTLIKRMLDQEKDPNDWKEAISILGKYFYDESKEFLKESVKHPVPEVRKEIKYWIDHNEMWKVPSQLIYFGYSTEITDVQEQNKILQDKINVYPISRININSKGESEKIIRQFFNNKLKNVKFVTASTIDLYAWGLDVSNNIQGYNFKILQRNLRKELDQISGELRFIENATKKQYKKLFEVDAKNDQIVAMRNQDRLALILLHFQTVTKETDITKGELYFYHSEFSNVLGCVVLSTRNSWNSDELNKEGGVEDFGQAKVKIPGKKGDWFLTGDIIVNRKEKHFIGRNAKLMNHAAEIVAEGSQIIVLADHPEKYEVGKK